jgi:diadenosine tetraphosphate (Ap4A) HIT family hydrolase
MTLTLRSTCDLCDRPDGDVAYRCEKYRIVLVDDINYPGFCRVIWNSHVKEVTDLTWPDRAVLMNAVWQVEQAVREVMRPDKINLASLGNVMPHLHWHIIPRYLDDAHFPSPVWAEAQRTPAPSALAARAALLPALREAVSRLAGLE